MITLYIILGVLLVTVFWAIFVYNILVSLRNRTKEAWSDIDVQLKRRYNLIPNLVGTVKGYASHEKELFQKVTEARTKAMGAQTMQEHSESENMLASTLKSLFAVVENYPDLKASQNMLAVQEELTSTENKISFARQHYNDSVMRFNTKIEMFPSNIIAGMFGFKQEEFFEVEGEEERKAVKVKF